MLSRKYAWNPVRLGESNALLMLAATLTALAAACGSPDKAATPAIGPGISESARKQDDGLKTSLVTRPDKTYALDDLTAVGWKKSRTFEIETLPGATAAVLGFFNQKDIEVWVYSAHADALRQGVPAAETAIARKGDSDLRIGPAQVIRRHAYAVVGNLVLLCERELADCEALIAKLP